jgi:hypothetical protein
VTALYFEKSGSKFIEPNFDEKYLRDINGKIDFKP